MYKKICMIILFLLVFFFAKDVFAQRKQIPWGNADASKFYNREILAAMGIPQWVSVSLDKRAASMRYTALNVPQSNTSDTDHNLWREDEPGIFESHQRLGGQLGDYILVNLRLDTTSQYSKLYINYKLKIGKRDINIDRNCLDGSNFLEVKNRIKEYLPLGKSDLGIKHGLLVFDSDDPDDGSFYFAPIAAQYYQAHNQMLATLKAFGDQNKVKAFLKIKSDL